MTVQTGKSHISLFRVEDGNKIVEAKDLSISIGANEEIKLLEFDRKFEYFVLIVEGKKMLEENSYPKAFHRLQQHKIDDIAGKLSAIYQCDLNETVDLNRRKKQLVLSDDAQSVLIAGGD